MAETIILKGDPIRKEAIAGESITPGHLVQFSASTGKLIKHATAGGNAQAMFAVEEDFIGDDIDTAYAADDQAQYNVFRPGDEVYALLAASQTIKQGDALESAGDGTLRKHTAPAINEGGSASVTVYVDAVVGYAAEDKTTGSGETKRIKVEVA